MWCVWWGWARERVRSGRKGRNRAVCEREGGRERERDRERERERERDDPIFLDPTLHEQTSHLHK